MISRYFHRRRLANLSRYAAKVSRASCLPESSHCLRSAGAAGTLDTCVEGNGETFAGTSADAGATALVTSANDAEISANATSGAIALFRAISRYLRRRTQPQAPPADVLDARARFVQRRHKNYRHNPTITIGCALHGNGLHRRLRMGRGQSSRKLFEAQSNVSRSCGMPMAKNEFGYFTFFCRNVNALKEPRPSRGAVRLTLKVRV